MTYIDITIGTTCSGTSGNSSDVQGAKNGHRMVLKRGDITIHASEAKALTKEELGAITRLNDMQVAQYPGLLNRFDPEAALAADAIFSYAVRDTALIAVAMGTAKDEALGRLMHIGGVNSNGSEPGIAVPLIATLVQGDALRSGQGAKAEAYVRIMPDGEVNQASSKTLMRLGFYSAFYRTHPVTPKNPQKAVTGSAEPDGGPLKYLLHRADVKELSAQSAAALDEWTIL